MDGEAPDAVTEAFAGAKDSLADLFHARKKKRDSLRSA